MRAYREIDVKIIACLLQNGLQSVADEVQDIVRHVVEVELAQASEREGVEGEREISKVRLQREREGEKECDREELSYRRSELTQRWTICRASLFLSDRPARVHRGLYTHLQQHHQELYLLFIVLQRSAEMQQASAFYETTVMCKSASAQELPLEHLRSGAPQKR